MNTFEILLTIDVIRTIPILIIFAYASYKDLKTKTVSNTPWKYIFIGCPIAITEYTLYAPTMLPIVIVSMIISTITAYVFYNMKHSWGGADAKAMITLALTIPIAPAYLAWLPLYPIIIIAIASAIAIPFMAHRIITKKSPKIPFIPFIFTSLIIMTII